MVRDSRCHGSKLEARSPFTDALRLGSRKVSDQHKAVSGLSLTGFSNQRRGLGKHRRSDGDHDERVDLPNPGILGLPNSRLKLQRIEGYGYESVAYGGTSTLESRYRISLCTAL
jgi:hypothetical protein